MQHIVMDLEGFPNVSAKRIVILWDSAWDDTICQDGDIVIPNASTLLRKAPDNFSMQTISLILNAYKIKNIEEDIKKELDTIATALSSSSVSVDIAVTGGEKFDLRCTQNGHDISNLKKPLHLERQVPNSLELTLTYGKEKKKIYDLTLSLNNKKFTMQNVDLTSIPGTIEDFLLEQIANRANNAISSTDLQRVSSLNYEGFTDMRHQYTGNTALQWNSIFNIALGCSMLSCLLCMVGRAIVGKIRHETLLLSKAADFGRPAGFCIGAITFGVKFFLNWQSKNHVNTYLKNCPDEQTIELGS